MTAVIIEDVKLITRNTLRGFVRARFPSGMIMAEIAIHVSSGKAWASPPALKMLDRSGTPLLDSNGKPRWQALITFSSKSVRDLWSNAVLEGVHDLAPEMLADVPEPPT